MVESGIFISYRREDSAGHAGRLYDRLSAHFGEEKIFMDLGMEPGIDFVDQLEMAVESCAALLVLIGPEWLQADDGRRRLEEAGDFVRLEVTSALDRDVRVIPLLVHGAKMPTADELPGDLARLARRNALELSDGRWRYDVGRLIEVLERVLERHRDESAPAGSGPALSEAEPETEPEPEPEPAPEPEPEPEPEPAPEPEPEPEPAPTGRPPDQPAAPPTEALRVPSPGPPPRTDADTADGPGPAAGPVRDGPEERSDVRIHRARRPAPAALAALGGLAVLVAVLLVTGVLGGGDEETPPQDGPADVPSVIELGADSGPDGIAVGSGSVWVAESRKGRVARIDADTGRVEPARVEVGHDPDSVAARAGSVWVTSTRDDELWRIDADDPSRARPVARGVAPEGVAVDREAVWVVNSRGRSVMRAELPGLESENIELKAPAQDVTAGAPGIAWVSVPGRGEVIRVNARPGEEGLEHIDTGGRPRGLAKDSKGYIWVVDNEGDRVVVIGPQDESGDRSLERVPVGGGPIGIAIADGTVWITNSDDATVTRIDERSREPIGEELDVGRRPIGIAARGGVAWVANYEDGTVTRLAPGES